MEEVEDGHGRRVQVLRAEDPADPQSGERLGRGDRDDVAEGDVELAERERDVLHRPARHRRPAVIDALLAGLDCESEPVDKLLRQDVDLGPRVENEERLDPADRHGRQRRMPAVRDRGAGQDPDGHGGTIAVGSSPGRR